MFFLLAGIVETCNLYQYIILYKVFIVCIYILFIYIFSDRKRMSVILRTPEGEIKLLIKGAVSFENLKLSLHSYCPGFCDI